MKKYRNKIIIGAIAAVVLAFVFWWGGDAPTLRGWNPEGAVKVGSAEAAKSVGEGERDKEEIDQNESDKSEASDESEPPESDKPEAEGGGHMTAEEKTALAERMAQNSADGVKADSGNGENYVHDNAGDIEYSMANGMEISEDTGKDIYKTEPVPEGQPTPVEPNETEISDKEMTCTLSVRCDAIFNHISWLDREKRELLPEDGVIFPEQSVKFYDGESVFNLLVREMKRNKIHMEFESTPVYNSAYIEGIGNIYEFDCGELSGWMYRVNGWFPNYGCSRYRLKEGDRVEWVYTCDLGADVGGDYSARNGR
ncbi:MAG: DUF4430 domain-containing protein [Monoglobaceae bacterium]